MQHRVKAGGAQSVTAVEEAAAAKVQSSDQTQVMPLLMEPVRETQFPSTDKKASDVKNPEEEKQIADMQASEKIAQEQEKAAR